MKSFFYVESTPRKKLLIVRGISNACRSMWKIYIYTTISLVECELWTSVPVTPVLPALIMAVLRQLV